MRHIVLFNYTYWRRGQQSDPYVTHPIKKYISGLSNRDMKRLDALANATKASALRVITHLETVQRLKHSNVVRYHRR
jgi:hypothetical protein